MPRGGFEPSILRKRAAADPRLRPLDYGIRQAGQLDFIYLIHCADEALHRHIRLEVSHMFITVEGISVACLSVCHFVTLPYFIAVLVK